MRFITFLVDQQGGWNGVAASQQQLQSFQDQLFLRNVIGLLFKGLGLALVIFIAVKVATRKSKGTDQNS